MDSISAFSIASNKENIQCIKTALTVPTTQSFVIKFYSRSSLLSSIFLCIPKIQLVKSGIWKFESIHGVFGLFHNFRHMAILISAHSTEDKQIVIWGSKCFQCCFRYF